MRVYIDFETRSAADIKKVGAWVYSVHPSTTVLCACFIQEDGKNVTLVRDFDISKELRRLASDPNITFVAHNAFFEQSIWANILVKRFEYPDVPISRWHCTMSKAAAWGVPKSLELSCIMLDLANLKDTKAKAAMLRLCKIEAIETCQDLETLYTYCAKDVLATRALDKALRDLTPQERKVWELDQKINILGVAVDPTLVKQAISVFNTHSVKLIERVVEATDGELDGVTKRQRVIDWLAGRGVAMDALSREAVTVALDMLNPTDKNAKVVLKARQQLSKTSIAKYETLDRTVDNGRVRDLFLYHAAITGRWSGRMVQVQNLPRGVTGMNTKECAEDILSKSYLDIYKKYNTDICGVLSTAIRGCFIAPPNKKLIVVDYNAIETRVLFWVAGEAKGLQKFYDKEDLYVDMAKAIYQMPTLSKHDAKERQLGKKAVLGCGYGMGEAKFYESCVTEGLGIGQDTATQAVRAYRSIYSAVPLLWRNQETMAKKAVHTKRVVDCGKVKWGLYGKWLLCILPSGRAIPYCFPNLKADTYGGDVLGYSAPDSKTGHFKDTTAWGGKLVENIVQAIARDILAEAMLRLDRQGYSIVMHCHDEVVIECDKETKVEDIENIMCELPKWADGCPIAVEGWEDRRYKK